jgi:tetratricopeptide (TPR) repeat protein
MPSPQAERLLSEGIAASRRGQHAEARHLLEQVVQTDPTVVDAWWWLSEITSGQERIICLENILTLDPEHTKARALLSELRAVHPPPDPTSRENYATIPPIDPHDPSLDDPFQCVYCGWATRPQDERCPHCNRSLVTHERTASQRTGMLVALLVVMAVLAIWSGVEVIGLLLRPSSTTLPPAMQTLANVGLIDPGESLSATFLRTPLARALFGNLGSLPFALARRLFLVANLRFALLIALALVLYLRWTPAYYATLAALIIGLVWDVFQVANSYIGWLLVLLSLALSMLALLLLFASEPNFALKVVRMQTRLHPAATGAAGGYNWGKRYTHEGKHALAVLHFRRAVGSAPNESEYYKRLGLSYAHIGRYARSLRELEQARKLNPDDADIPRVEALVREMQHKTLPNDK